MNWQSRIVATALGLLLSPIGLQASSLESSESAAISVWSEMLSGMSSGRKDIMERRAKFFIVPRQTPVSDTVLAVLKEYLEPADAQAQSSMYLRSLELRLNETVHRTPQNPRGFTGRYYMKNQVVAFSFVGQENLDAAGEWDEHGSRSLRVLIHELGHAVYHVAMTNKERAELKSIVIEYMKEAPVPYQTGDEDELFAQNTEIWFGKHQLGLHQPGWSASEQFVKLAPMMRFLETIYGPSRNIR